LYIVVVVVIVVVVAVVVVVVVVEDCSDVCRADTKNLLLYAVKEAG
jgi:hypothetical protein